MNIHSILLNGKYMNKFAVLNISLPFVKEKYEYKNVKASLLKVERFSIRKKKTCRVDIKIIKGKKVVGFVVRDRK